MRVAEHVDTLHQVLRKFETILSNVYDEKSIVDSIVMAAKSDYESVKSQHK